MPSKISQTEKDKYHMISLMCGIQNKKFKYTEKLKEQYHDHLDSVITHFFTKTHLEKELSILLISFFFKKKIFFIEVQSIYNVVPISAEQQMIQLYTYVHFKIFFSIQVHHRISVLQKSREKRCDTICRSIYAIASGEKGVRGLPPLGVEV